MQIVGLLLWKLNYVLPVFQPMHPTIEDIYTAMIETDRGVKEKVRIFDTGGLVSIFISPLYTSPLHYI